MRAAPAPTLAGVGRVRRRQFPGRRMVRVLAVTETVGYGALFYCFAVLVVPMRAELGATTAQVSGALSVSLAVAGAAAPLVGRWVDRHGARWLMTAGSVLAGASVLAWSRAGSVAELYVAFVGVGLAGAAVLYEPAFAVVAAWFRRGRARALLTVTVVAGFSSTIFLPLTQVLVDRLGWRDALVVLAVLVGSCAVPHAVVLRRSPADLGLAPDGDAPVPTAPSEATPPLPPDPGHAVDPAGRPRAVRWLTVAAVLQAVAGTTVAVHLVGYLRDHGIAPGHAALGAGALGVMSVAGRLAFVGGGRSVGPAQVAAALLVAQTVGVVVLLVVPGTAGLVAFVVLAGAGFGVMTIARAALLGTYAPPGRYASVSGRQALATTVGRVAAPVAAGATVTAAGYVPAFAGVAVCSLGAAAALLAAERSAG